MLRNVRFKFENIIFDMPIEVPRSQEITAQVEALATRFGGKIQGTEPTIEWASEEDLIYASWPEVALNPTLVRANLTTVILSQRATEESGAAVATPPSAGPQASAAPLSQPTRAAPLPPATATAPTAPSPAGEADSQEVFAPDEAEQAGMPSTAAALTEPVTGTGPLGAAAPILAEQGPRSLRKWLCWDGRFDLRAALNRPTGSGGRPVPERAAAGASEDTRPELRLMACEIHQGRVWVNFELRTWARFGALLFRVQLSGPNPDTTALVYQEVLDAEILDLLPDAPDTATAAATVDPVFERRAYPFKVSLHFSDEALRFRHQREGSRRAPSRPTRRQPKPAEPALVAGPAATPASAPVATEGYAWSAWASPDPSLTEMLRQGPGSGVIQRMTDGYAWSAWGPPTPLAEVTAERPTIQAPNAQGPPMAEPDSAQTKAPQPRILFRAPEWLHAERAIPTSFTLHLGLCAGLPHWSTVPQADSAPANPSSTYQPIALVNGIRGVVTIAGRHHCELYHLDHPDNLYLSGAFLIRQQFGETLEPQALRARTVELLKRMLAQRPLDPALLAAIPATAAVPVDDVDRRVAHYLSQLEDPDCRGDLLQLVALGLWLRVEIQLFDVDGRRLSLPLNLCGRFAHCLRMVLRRRSDIADRYAPLIEGLANLTDCSMLPYELSGVELEALYRDATLSPTSLTRYPNTLLKRVTRFYRIRDEASSAHALPPLNAS